MIFILCEQCGNEFGRYKKILKENGTAKALCPYCRWENPLPKKKKKENDSNEKR